MEVLTYLILLVMPFAFMLLAMRKHEHGYENYKLTFYVLAATCFILSAMAFIGSTDVTMTVETAPAGTINADISCAKMLIKDTYNAGGNLTGSKITCLQDGKPSDHTAEYGNASIHISGLARADVEIGAGLTGGNRDAGKDLATQPETTTYYLVKGQHAAIVMSLIYFILGIIMVLFTIHELVNIMYRHDNGAGGRIRS